MEAFFVQLEKSVKCTLCADKLIEPRILKCFHSFCKLCIKRHAELIGETNIFKCPECKTETFLGELNSVEDLQPSPIHSRILKGLALVEGEKVCSVSESHSPVSWYCFDCDNSLCQECEKSHSFFMKDHTVVRLAELKKEDIELIITRENQCKNHPNQRLELFCEDCDTMICLACLKRDHTDHKLIKLDKLASMKRDMLAKRLEVLNKLRIDEKYKKQQEDIATTIKQEGEEAKRVVKDKTEKMVEILHQNQLELLKQIEDKMETATRNLDIIHHIPAITDHINKVMDMGLASEILETHHSDRFTFNPIQQYSKIVFVLNKELMQQVNSGLGEIRETYSKTDPAKSTIQVKCEPEALKEETLMLITRTSTGEFSDNPGDVVDLKLSPEENVKVEEKYESYHGKTELVRFKAKVAGQLTAEVKVNGSHVSNSPLVLDVKPQQMRRTKRFKMKGTSTRSHHMNGITVNKESSRIAVADESAHCVHVFDIHGDLLLTYGSGKLQNPEGLAFLNETELVIADHDNDRICIVNTMTGKLVKAFGNKGGKEGEFFSPNGIIVDDDGSIIVCDSDNHRVQVFTTDGDYQYQFGLKSSNDDFFEPCNIVTHGTRFYVSDYNNHIIHVFEKKDGVPTKMLTIGEAGSDNGQLCRPWGLAIDIDQNLLVCDNGNNRIQKFTLDGRFVGKTYNKIDNPLYIAVMNEGQLLITSYDFGVHFLE